MDGYEPPFFVGHLVERGSRLDGSRWRAELNFGRTNGRCCCCCYTRPRGLSGSGGGGGGMWSTERLLLCLGFFMKRFTCLSLTLPEIMCSSLKLSL